MPPDIRGSIQAVHCRRSGPPCPGKVSFIRAGPARQRTVSQERSTKKEIFGAHIRLTKQIVDLNYLAYDYVELNATPSEPLNDLFVREHACTYHSS